VAANERQDAPEIGRLLRVRGRVPREAAGEDHALLLRAALRRWHEGEGRP
jgi:hypothetical protein